jgi:hypothetical protein
MFMQSQIHEQNARSIVIVCDNAHITRLSASTPLITKPSNSIKDSRWQSAGVRSNRIQTSLHPCNFEMDHPRRSPPRGDSTLAPCSRCLSPEESSNTYRWEEHPTQDKNPSSDSLPCRPQKRNSFELLYQRDLPSSLRNKAPYLMEISHDSSVKDIIRSSELISSSVQPFDKMQEREDTASSTCNLSPSSLSPSRCKSKAARGA